MLLALKRQYCMYYLHILRHCTAVRHDYEDDWNANGERNQSRCKHGKQGDRPDAIIIAKTTPELRGCSEPR
jgi:hypothetical protein